MCFSAQASFTASLLLLTSGCAALYYGRKTRYTLLALTPLLFSLQQAVEGALWLSLTNGLATLQTITTYVFLIFAGTIWPCWVSRALLAVEHNPTRRIALLITKNIGDLTGLVLLVLLCMQGAHASLHNHHIAYFMNISNTFYMYGLVAYILATALPFLLTTIPFMWLGCLGIVGGYGITYYYYYYELGSVWCFVVALLSLFIVLVIRKQVRNL